MKPYEDAYLLRKKEKDSEMYMQGLYIRESILSSICNMWLKKGTQPHEYPKKSFSELREEEGSTNNKVLTEDEKKQQTELFFRNLSLMKANYNLTHSKNK